MPRKRRPSHENPNYSFLEDLKLDRTPLESPIQELLASTIQEASRNGWDANQGLVFAPTLNHQIPGGVPATLGEAEQVLMKSYYPQMLTIGQRLENTNVGMGDLVNEMITPSNPDVPGFRQSVLNWDPSKGSLFTHMTNSLKNSAQSAVRGYTTLGMSLDAGGNFDTGFGGSVDLPDSAFSGTTAPYDMPAPQPWYQQAVNTIGNNTIPTPFYAPPGQGMFMQDASGRTVINPNLTRHAAKGYEQVSITGPEVAGYANTLEGYYGVPKEDRVLDFGTGPQVKGVNKFLRSFNNQAQGMEFISTDAQVLGAVAGAEDAFLRTHKATPSVLDATVQARGTTDAAYLENVRSGQVGSSMVNTGVTIDGDPVEWEQPVRSVNEAVYETLDTFSSPTEQLAKSAAYEATVMGRLGADKVRRWKIENPNAAKAQTLAWKNAKGAAEFHQRSEEAVINSIESDPSIPEEYKQQAIDSVMGRELSTRPFGDYGSQVTEAARRVVPAAPAGGGNGSQPPQPPVAFAEPEPPEEPNEPVSDVGNLAQPAAMETVQRAQEPVAARQAGTVRQLAEEGRAWFKQNYPDYVPGKGRAPQWLRDLRASNPQVDRYFNALMNEERLNGPQSVRQNWNENNAVAPASSAAVSASNTAPASSNGSGAGVTPSTSTPGSSSELYNAYGVRQQWEDAKRAAVEARGDSDRQATEDLRDITGENPDGSPVDVPARAAEGAQNAYMGLSTSPQRIVDSWRGFLKNSALGGLNGRLISGVEVPHPRGGTMALRPGYAHGEYGQFKPTDGTDFSKGGEYYNGETGELTINREQVGRGMGIINQAIDEAVNAGGLEGLSNREVAATLHKRVGDAINKIAKSQLEEAEKNPPPGETIDSIRETMSKAKTVAYDMNNLGVGHGLKAVSGTSAADLANAAEDFRNPADLRELMQTNPALAQRIEELGGVEAVAGGRDRILEADGQTYRVGQGGAGAPGGGWRSARTRSIYQTTLGHLMMAQFMGSMAWQQTGGEVLKEAAGYGAEQYGYAQMANYGDGEASGATMFASRQELARSRAGALAYEQYGVLNELGYAVSGMPAGKFLTGAGNDLKFGLGAGVAAGVGTWGLGSLVTGQAAAIAAATGVEATGMAAAGAGLTAAALPVGLGVAAGVGGSMLAMTAYNNITGQDNYEGMGLKNLLAGQVLMSSSGLQGFAMRMTGVLGGAALTDGSNQERFAQNNFGKSAEDVVNGSLVGRMLGKETTAWLFEGRDEKSTKMRELVEGLSESTGLKADDIRPGIQAMQVAFGGLDDDKSKLQANFLFKQATDQGLSVNAILSSAESIASQRGVLTGTEDFKNIALQFAGMDPQEKQKMLIQSSRDYQKYAQWSGYLEGGNAEAYGLFNELGGTNNAQTQVIQSVLAQAQMSGANLTPALAQNLATTANGMAPWRAQDITQMASSMYQIGAGSFGSNFTNLAGAANAGQFGFNLSDVGNLATGSISMGAGNQADTLNFLKGVTSGNAYALSDYGRMAGIGVLQSMDANGLQTGLKDMSGLLMYANQNILGGGNMTGAQTLAGLGMNFNATSESALLNGGIWGYQQSYMNQQNSLQAQSLGLQFTQLDQNRSYMYSSWGLENQMNTLQWNQQLAGFNWQNTMLDTNNRFRKEDAALSEQQRSASNDNTRWTQAFDYQTNLMRRDWAREDYQFSTQMRELNFGWNMEDMDERIRRSSGYERAQLIKQRDRATLSNNLQSGQAEEQFERQEKLWAREDERYQKGLEFTEKMISFDRERFELNQKQADEMYELQKGHLADELESATQLHDVRMEMEKLARERQEEQLRMQEQSLNIQRQMQELTNEYQQNMTTISHTQTEMEASLRKITSYQPAFSRLLQDFMSFLEDAQGIQVPTISGGGTTYR